MPSWLGAKTRRDWGPGRCTSDAFPVHRVRYGTWRLSRLEKLAFANFEKHAFASSEKLDFAGFVGRLARGTVPNYSVALLIAEAGARLCVGCTQSKTSAPATAACSAKRTIRGGYTHIQVIYDIIFGTDGMHLICALISLMHNIISRWYHRLQVYDIIYEIRGDFIWYLLWYHGPMISWAYATISQLYHDSGLY